MSNEHICSVLEQMRQLRVNQNEGYKAKAYAKAIEILRDRPPIKSGKEAILLPGIGKSIADKIDEILTTGTLKELESSEPNPQETERLETIQRFKTIERVGQKIAERWYNLGYRQISDIPQKECTTGQWLCIQLYDELIQRIPRAEIEAFEQKLHETCDPLGIRFEICGSYRRGKETSGDIDVLVIDSRPNTMADVLQCPIFLHTLALGTKKYLGIGKVEAKSNSLHRRIDIELVQPQEYPFALTYFTGPARFNVMMREQCASLGYRLNEKTITDTNGTSYSVDSEEELFNAIGWQYLTPVEREQYA